MLGRENPVERFLEPAFAGAPGRLDARGCTHASHATGVEPDGRFGPRRLRGDRARLALLQRTLSLRDARGGRRGLPAPLPVGPRQVLRRRVLREGRSSRGIGKRLRPASSGRWTPASWTASASTGRAGSRSRSRGSPPGSTSPSWTAPSNGIADTLQAAWRGYRRVQTGRTENYALTMAVGVFGAVCLWIILR